MTIQTLVDSDQGFSELWKPTLNQKETIPCGVKINGQGDTTMWPHKHITEP